MSYSPPSGYRRFLFAVFVLAGAMLATDVTAQKSGSTRAESDALWGTGKERVNQNEASKSRAAKRNAQLGAAARRESFLRYNVIGGEEGVDRELTIRGDGTMKLKDESGNVKEGKLSASALKQVIKQFNLFDKLDPVYGEKNSDPFQKTITVSRKVAKNMRKSSAGTVLAPPKNDTDSVTVYDSAGLVIPRDLTRMIDGMDRLIETRLVDKVDVKVEFRGIVASGMIDRFSFPLLMSEPPVPSEMWFHIAVANLTEEPFQISFGNEQAYEITIFNDAGEPVWRYSDGKRFGNRGSRERLVKNSLSYIERIPLVDETGVALPAGDYRIRYEVRSQPSFMGESSFKIEAIEPKAQKEEFKSLLARHRAAMKQKEAAAAASGNGKAAKQGKNAKQGKTGNKNKSGGGNKKKRNKGN